MKICKDYTALHCQNFKEHDYNVKIEQGEKNPDTGSVIYGRLHELEVTDICEPDCVELTGLSVKVYRGNNFERTQTAPMRLYMNGDPWSSIITLGDKTLNLYFYSKTKFLEIVKDMGVKVS